MFDRYRGDRQSLTFSYDIEGGLAIALKDVGSRTIGRLERVAGGTAPFDSWWAETYGQRWRIDAEGRRSSWAFDAREVSSDNVAASARRRRWRLGTYDIWMVPDRRFRLHCSYVRGAALRNAVGDRVATIDLGSRRAGSIKIWPAAKSVPALVLLLLLSVRVELFEQASHVGLPPPGGGGCA
jgi:hypothetical protein